MRPFLKFFILMLSAAAMALGAPSHARAEEKFPGVPRDIDYIKNAGWTQVILLSLIHI